MGRSKGYTHKKSKSSKADAAAMVLARAAELGYLTKCEEGQTVYMIVEANEGIYIFISFEILAIFKTSSC